MGISKMVRRNGGPETLGCRGFMRHAISSIWEDFHILNPHKGTTVPIHV